MQRGGENQGRGEKNSRGRIKEKREGAQNERVRKKKSRGKSQEEAEESARIARSFQTLLILKSKPPFALSCIFMIHPIREEA